MKSMCTRCLKKFNRTTKFNRTCNACCKKSQEKINANRKEIEIKKIHQYKKTMELIQISKEITKRKKKVIQ